VGVGTGAGSLAVVPTSARLRSTAADPPGLAVNPKVVAAPAASDPFQCSLRTVYRVPARAAITPFHRLEIVPSKSKVTVHDASGAVPVFRTVTSPLKPLPQSLVTANDTLPVGDGAGGVGGEIVRGDTGSDPASVAHRAVARALEGGFDVCIVDTAGRLQTQSNLMQELGKIRRVIAKQIPDAPHETLLVIDSTAGQNALSQAKGFKEAAGCTGIVLAKLDGSARGGVIVPVAEQFGLPVKFVGLGEGADDLEPFSPDQFLEALLSGALAEA